MAWTDSRVFRQFFADTLAGTSIFDLDAPSDAYKVALYNNSITPDRDVTAANSAYNVAQWATAQEQFQAGQWAQGGVAGASLAITVPVTSVIQFSMANTASGAACTLANVYGSLIYDDTKAAPVAKQGVVFNYFGGTTGVTGGTYTVVWQPTTGIFRITV